MGAPVRVEVGSCAQETTMHSSNARSADGQESSLDAMAHMIALTEKKIHRKFSDLLDQQAQSLQAELGSVNHRLDMVQVRVCSVLHRNYRCPLLVY